MAGLIERIGYFTRQSAQRLAGRSGCPNCGHDRFELRDRKALVTELRACLHCRLMYRYPVDPPERSVDFYQTDYRQGFTTTMPDDATLAQLIDRRFVGHEKDYAPLVELIARLGIRPGMRVFDFGCSWGFGSWQFARAGYTVTALEISRDRARYARDKLAVDVFDDLAELEAERDLHGTFDLFFSNHVLEHVPSPSDVVATARRLLKPGGLFLAITPNGSLSYRAVSRESWHRSWGKVHPNMLSDAYWAREFAGTPHFIGSLPNGGGRIGSWAAQPTEVQDDLRGNELVCAAQL